MHKVLIPLTLIVLAVAVLWMVIKKKKEGFTTTQMKSVYQAYDDPNKGNGGEYSLGFGYSPPTKKNYDKIPVYSLITVTEMPEDKQMSRIGVAYNDYGDVLDVYRSEYTDGKIAYYFVNEDFQYLLFADKVFEDGDQAVFQEFRYDNPFTFSIRQGQFGPQD